MTQDVLWKLVDVSESEFAEQLMSETHTQKERATDFKQAT